MSKEKFDRSKPHVNIGTIGHDDNDKTYYSNASWTKIPDSRDGPNSYDFEHHMCMRLRDDYGPHGRPCEVRGHCTDSWVTDEDGKKVTREAHIDDIRRNTRDSRGAMNALNTMAMLGGYKPPRIKVRKEPLNTFSQADRDYLDTLGRKDKKKAVKLLKAKYAAYKVKYEANNE